MNRYAQEMDNIRKKMGRKRAPKLKDIDCLNIMTYRVINVRDFANYLSNAFYHIDVRP